MTEEITEATPEKTIDTPISDAELLLSILSEDQIASLSEEQQAQIAGLKKKVQVVKIETERESYIKGINDTLMINAKSIKDSLPVDIPSIASVISLGFAYSQETQVFEPIDAIPKTKYSSGAVILDIEVNLYNALQSDLDSKKSKDIAKNTFDAVGKENLDIPDFAKVLVETGEYRSNCLPKLKDCYTKEYVNSLRNNIDIPEKYKEHLATGAVVFTWNSVALLKSLDPESDPVGGKTRRDYVGIKGRWSITSCAFNKSVSKAKSTGTKGARSTNMDWLPEHLQAKCKNQIDYILQIFPDDTKIKELVAKHTTDRVMDWSKVNKGQHITRLEKDKPESEQYYINRAK